LELWEFYTYQLLLHILTQKEHIQKRWKEYFQRVLESNLNDIDSMTFYTVENEDIQLSYEELKYVIKCLKNHKVPGTDQIMAELQKKGESMEKKPPSY